MAKPITACPTLTYLLTLRNDTQLPQLYLPIESIKYVQWHARGLTKSKLSEFKHFLSSFSPEIVLLSETHWHDRFNVKFEQFFLLKKNRIGTQGGGVAILVHRSLQFNPFIINTPESVEAIGVSLFSSQFGPINFISVYCSRGSFGVNDIVSLFNSENPPFSLEAILMHTTKCKNLTRLITMGGRPLRASYPTSRTSVFSLRWT